MFISFFALIVFVFFTIALIRAILDVLRIKLGRLVFFDLVVRLRYSDGSSSLVVGVYDVHSLIIYRYLIQHQIFG